MEKTQEDKINWQAMTAVLIFVTILIMNFQYQKDIEARKPVLSLNPIKFEKNDLFILYEEDRLEIDIEVENRGETIAKIDEIKIEDIEFRVKVPEKGIDIIIDGDSSVENNILAKGERTTIGLTYEPINKEDIEFFRDNRAYFYIYVRVHYTGDPNFFNKRCYISRIFEVRNDKVVFGVADFDCIKRKLEEN